MPRLWLLWTPDLFLVKAIPFWRKEAADLSATGLAKFIEGFFHKHVRLRRDGEPATVALANKVKHLAGDLVKFETTPKHNSASNPAERAIQAVEEQVRTIRADCQMRFGSGETFGTDKPIWAWLLRHAGWQISRYKQKGNGMTRSCQGSQANTSRSARGKMLAQGRCGVFVKGVWVGRSETSDERVVLTLGGRVFGANDSTIGTISSTRCWISR